MVVYYAYKETRDAAGQMLCAGSWPHPLLSGLEGAVGWFFVLSGFVIFLPFARAAVAGQEPIDGRRFLVRRAWRILPAYYVAVLVVWTLRFANLPEQSLDLAEHLTFTQILDPRHMFWTIGPAAKLDAFALGMALALLVAVRPAWELDRGTRTLLWCTGAALLLWVFVGRDRGWYAPPHFHSLCGLAFLPILAPTVARGAAPGFSLLASAPLRWLGLVSYSLYLWHEPLLLVLGRRNLLISPEPADFPRNTLVLVGLALGMATLSYHLVERPALRLRAATERPAGSHAGA